MSHASTVKLLLKRGVLVTAANWEAVMLQFLAETAFKLLLVVPVIGAAFLVALLVGGSAVDLARADVQQILAVLLAAFGEHPAMVIAYTVGLVPVIVGGALLTFLVKGGTVTTLVSGDRQARAVEQLPVGPATIGRAAAFRLEIFMAACGRLFRRYVRLGCLLATAYAAAGLLYAAAVVWAFRAVSAAGVDAAWTMIAAVISGILVLAITCINLMYLLLQVAVAVDDCSVRTAARQVRAFLAAEAVTVMMLFATLLVVVGLATAASILMMAGLGVIGFIPVVGLAVFPLQLGAWVARGLVFQYLGLSALAAYLHLYRVHKAGQDRFRPTVTPLVSRPA
jgi:hypothetical protein